RNGPAVICKNVAAFLVWIVVSPSNKMVKSGNQRAPTCPEAEERGMKDECHPSSLVPHQKPAMRSTWTSLTDSQLLAQCEVDTYRASGPGGQKRNKTSSAVRLRHLPSGLIVIAEESRSQHENRARALRRLRQAVFLKVRDDLPPQIEQPETLVQKEEL